MSSKAPLIGLLAGLALGGGSAAAQSAPPALDLPALSEIAERIVRQLALRPGEKVLLLAHPGEFQELVPLLRRAVTRAGGIDLGCWLVLPGPPPAGDDAAAVASRRAAREALRALLGEVDAAVMLPGAAPVHPEYAAMQDVLTEGRGRTVHFHWHGGGAPSAVEVPGHPLPPGGVIDATYQRALLQSDYGAIAEAQRRFARAMRAGEVRVTTPLGTDLRFRIGERPVNFQDGDASAARAAQAVTLIDREIELPAGVVRVAPLEETVEGTIAFPPSEWNGERVEGLRLRFAAGRAVEVEAATAAGRAAALAELERGGEGARAFREFALGFNPELAVPADAPWIPYYGYGAGVVRLSLGDNTELGGKVSGGAVRWNFFTDATVSAGGEVWVKDGRLAALTP